MWGEVHDENAYGFGGVAGHAGVFSCAWDLAVLGRTLLNGGAYGRARILRPASVELMFTDFNTGFPGDAHGLGFELYQHWYMGAMATPRTAGHTGFTGTSLVLDPTTDSFLVVLGNSVHPVRSWRSGSAPRVAAADNHGARRPGRPGQGRTAWFSGMASATATLTLPALRLATGAGAAALLRCGGTPSPARMCWSCRGVPPTAAAGPGSRCPSRRVGPVRSRTAHPTGSVSGWSGRVWHRLTADLAAWRGARGRGCAGGTSTDRPYVGRGAYVDGLRVEDGDRTVFDERRQPDAARIEAAGWTVSAD